MCRVLCYVCPCRLRFSVAFWHSFRGDGSDPFGSGTKAWPWSADKDPLQVRALIKPLCLSHVYLSESIALSACSGHFDVFSQPLLLATAFWVLTALL
jgi:hypothetical protein